VSFPDGRAAPSVRDCSRSAAKQPPARNARSTSRYMQRVLTATLWAKARRHDRVDPARQWLRDRRLRKMAPDAAVRDHPRRRGNNPHSLFGTAPARVGMQSNIVSITRAVGPGEAEQDGCWLMDGKSVPDGSLYRLLRRQLDDRRQPGHTRHQGLRAGRRVPVHRSDQLDCDHHGARRGRAISSAGARRGGGSSVTPLAPALPPPH